MKFHFRGFGCVFVPFAMFNSFGVIHSSSSEDTIFSHDSTAPFDVFEPRFTDAVSLYAFQEVANGRFIKKPKNPPFRELKTKQAENSKTDEQNKPSDEKSIEESIALEPETEKVKKDSVVPLKNIEPTKPNSLELPIPVPKVADPELENASTQEVESTPEKKIKMPLPKKMSEAASEAIEKNLPIKPIDSNLSEQVKQPPYIEKKEVKDTSVFADSESIELEFAESSEFINPFQSSDFFSGNLDLSLEEDAMGKQRVVDVMQSFFSPSIAFNSSYNYTSNPVKVAEESQGFIQDGFTANFNLSMNMGLGEYALSENVLFIPALSASHMRTYNDPPKDYGDQQKAFDVDVQVLGLSFPFLLPDDFTLTVGHSYVRPIAFRTENIISYSNSPSVSLSKAFPMESGDVLSVVVGGSFTFSEGDTLKEQLNDDTYYSFIEEVMRQSGSDPLTQQPTNLQDGWNHTISLSYMKVLGERLILSPSFTYSHMMYAAGANTERSDKTYNFGLNASYPIFEWLSISSVLNYMEKTSNDDTVLNINDFTGGLSIGLNYAF